MVRSFFPLNIIFDYFFVIAFRFFSISEACPPSRALALVRQCHNNIPIIIAFFFSYSVLFPSDFLWASLTNAYLQLLNSYSNITKRRLRADDLPIPSLLSLRLPHHIRRISSTDTPHLS